MEKAIPPSWEIIPPPAKANTLNCWLTPSQHGALLHVAGRPGHVAVATKPLGQRWQEKAHQVGDLAEVLPMYAGQSDVYLSAQRFWGWRRLSRLAECGALAVDVDFHKVAALRDSHPLGVLEDCRIALERSRKPQPTLAIASGRGIWLLWLHEPVPRQALPRWNACQKELWEVLKPLGADRGSLDAARMLRLVGSRHGATGLTVEVLTPPHTGSSYGDDAWVFDDLANEVLPLDRAELHDLRIKRAARDARKPREERSRPSAPWWWMNPGTLWEARLTDLQTVRRLRWFGDLPPGQRDHWMFIAGNAMSWLAPPEVLERELYALAREVAGWHDRESKSRMHAIFKRSHMAAKGEKVVWEGVEVDPRYRFKTETIIEWLEIDDEEQKEMYNLISPEEKYRRKRIKEDEKRRRENPDGVTMEARSSRAAYRRSEARRMSSEGRPFEEIAAELGVSCHTINSYVYGRR